MASDEQQGGRRILVSDRARAQAMDAP
jgi:hypothetical protein